MSFIAVVSSSHGFMSDSIPCKYMYLTEMLLEKHQWSSLTDSDHGWLRIDMLQASQTCFAQHSLYNFIYNFFPFRLTRELYMVAQ